MKFTDKQKWIRIILALICVIGLLSLAGGSYAAYSRQAYKRGVATNHDSESVRFTSNYLQNCAEQTTEANYVSQTVLFTEAEKKSSKNLTVDIDIYNYVDGNTGLVSQKDIVYDLTITLKDGGGNENTYSVTPEGSKTDNGLTYTFTDKKLTGRSAKHHKYTVSFPGSDVDKLKIVAVATTKNLSSNQKLAAVIAPCTSSTTQMFSYKGEFIDTSKDPGEYDGFNYEISISSGSATGTLTWKDGVEIDSFFLKKIGKNDDEIKEILNSKKVELSMSQTEGSGDYVIPFYIKNRNQIPASWDAMKKLITFNAVQNTGVQMGDS